MFVSLLARGADEPIGFFERKRLASVKDPYAAFFPQCGARTQRP
jgi:hypothetical protein